MKISLKTIKNLTLGVFLASVFVLVQFNDAKAYIEEEGGWSCKCKDTRQPDGVMTKACVGDEYEGKPKCTCSNSCS